MVGRDCLLDTGPLVALLARSDPWHSPVTVAAERVLLRCLTTEAVAVEACHVVRRYGGEPAQVLEFLLASAIPVVAVHQPLHQQCVHLLHRYRGVPMDYADATIVAVADKLRLTRVFTLDRRGFRAYRDSRGQALELIPLSA